VDFTLTAILLVPQLLAWVYSHPEKVKPRAVGMWLGFFGPAPWLIARLGQVVGAPISGRVSLSAMLIFSALFLLPAFGGWGLKIRHDNWNRAGFAAALVMWRARSTPSCGIRTDSEIRRTLSPAGRIDRCAAASAVPLALGWARSHGPGVYELRMDLSD